MQDSNVIIISRHPLLAAAIRRAVEKSGAETIAQVEGVEQALPIIRRERPATIIVDLEPGVPCEAAATRLLAEHGADCQVVCISLDTSDITVYSRQHIPHAGQSELVAVLQRSLSSTLEEMVDRP